MIFLVITADAGKCKSCIFRLSTGLAHSAAHSFRHFVEFLDIAICDPTALQRLQGTTLKHQAPRPIAAQLHNLHTRHADINAQQWSRFSAEQRWQIDQDKLQ